MGGGGGEGGGIHNDRNYNVTDIHNYTVMCIIYVQQVLLKLATGVGIIYVASNLGGV